MKTLRFFLQFPFQHSSLLMFSKKKPDMLGSLRTGFMRPMGINMQLRRFYHRYQWSSNETNPLEPRATISKHIATKYSALISMNVEILLHLFSPYMHLISYHPGTDCGNYASNDGTNIRKLQRLSDLSRSTDKNATILRHIDYEKRILNDVLRVRAVDVVLK